MREYRCESGSSGLTVRRRKTATYHRMRMIDSEVIMYQHCTGSNFRLQIEKKSGLECKMAWRAGGPGVVVVL